MHALRTLIDALPFPVWARDREGRLDFVNAAYASAVEAREPTEAVERNLELLDRSARDEAARMREGGTPYRGRVPTVVAGARRIFDVVEVPTRSGSAGVGIDATEVENVRAEMARMVDAHRRTLDQLATGVAIFGADQTLRFYNAAYRALWDLDAAYLDHGPTDSAILDRLRAARKLPEQQDFRTWKNQLHEAYRSVEASEDLWHLPDGPHAARGDDAEYRRRRDLSVRRCHRAARPRAPIRCADPRAGRDARQSRRGGRGVRERRSTAAAQSGVPAIVEFAGRGARRTSAYRGSDRLVRAASAGGSDPARRCARPSPRSASAIRSRAGLNGATAAWSILRRCRCRTARRCVTFQDVTDTVNVERALRERNEALEAADQIKIDFLHHVSYELRSPLTNIIGFAHFLGDPSTGPLNDRQSEYLGYITVSTNALLALINDILDLATIDAGAMTLNLGPVDIRKTMEAAAEGIRDRLVKDNIVLDIEAAGGHRLVLGRRTPRSAGALQSSVQRGRLLAGQGRIVRLRAERTDDVDRVLGHRSGPRHSARNEGPHVRLVRDPSARLAASRRGARPVDRALVRAAAWRRGGDRVRSRARNHRDLHFPDEAACAAADLGGVTPRQGPLAHDSRSDELHDRAGR